MEEGPNKREPYDLQRFIIAQGPAYEAALAEIRAGRKRSHWMWFVFPQCHGLGTSPTSVHFAIRSLQEARAYLAHPVLGPRLIEACEAILAVEGQSAQEILGSPDDLKLRSCATLFALVSPPGSTFHQVLEKYYAGNPDERTIRLMKDASDGRKPD